MAGKQRAIFLDRDGTIIYHSKSHILKPSQLRLLPGVADSIKLFNELGFLVIIITNQPVISRGLISSGDVTRLHKILTDRLWRRGADIHATYFCPHHPDSRNPRWGIVCGCRKPEPGMILRAMKDFRVDSEKSFMIGDAVIDVVAGQRAKVKTIRVKTGPGHPRLDPMYADTKPDFTARNLSDAVEIIRESIDKDDKNL